MTEAYRFSCSSMWELYTDTLGQARFGKAADGIAIEAIERVYLTWLDRFRQACPIVGPCAQSPTCADGFDFVDASHARRSWFKEFSWRKADVNRTRWGGKVKIGSDEEDEVYRVVTTDDIATFAPTAADPGAEAIVMQGAAAELLDQLRDRAESWSFSNGQTGAYERMAVWRLLDPQARGDVSNLKQALKEALRAVAPDAYESAGRSPREAHTKDTALRRSIAHIKRGLRAIAEDMGIDPLDL